MSKTDKTRPWRVQITDAHAMRAVHRCESLRRLHAPRPCDLPTDPWSLSDTVCCWEPVREPVHWPKMFADQKRKHCRRQWYASERTARRATLRALTRDAAYGGEVDENVINNRVPGRYQMYSGGWWD